MYLIKYIWYVIKHKYYVYKFGRLLQVPFKQLVLHDMSKFGKAELKPYAVRFYQYGDVKKSKDLPEEVRKNFKKATKHHIDHNAHHYNSTLNLVPINSWTEDTEIIMSDVLIREMLADWLAMEWFYSEGTSINMTEFLDSRSEDFKQFSSDTYNKFTFYLAQIGGFKIYLSDGEEVYEHDDLSAALFLNGDLTKYFGG